MRRWALLFILGLASAAAVVHAGAGTTGAASLKLQAGARSRGFGDAYAAVAEGAEGLAWNPAALALGAPRWLAFGYQPLVDGASAGDAAISGRFGRWGVGGGFSGLSQGNLDALDTVGNKTGSFSASDQTFLAGAGVGTPAFAVGVAAKYWRSDIDGVSASALAADLGADFLNPLSKKLRHALVLRNLGGGVSYVSQKDPLPTTEVFGSSLQLGRRWIVADDIASERGRGVYNSIGTEFAVAQTSSLDFRLRGGYSSRKNQAGGLSGAAFGLGFGLKTFTLDYAWVPFGDLGDSHAITLTWRPAVPERRELLEPLHGSASKGKVSSRRMRLEDFEPKRR